MGPKGPSRLLPVSLGLNPSVQAVGEMKLQSASRKLPVMSCATLEKLEVPLTLMTICVKGLNQSCHKKPSPYFGKWESRGYLPGKGLERGGSQASQGSSASEQLGLGLWAGTQQVMG